MCTDLQGHDGRVHDTEIGRVVDFQPPVYHT